MGIHESQSRFFENIIGRSEPFLTYIFPKLVQLFPRQLEGVDAHMFWKAVNKASPSLIRTEAAIRALAFIAGELRVSVWVRIGATHMIPVHSVRHFP